MALSNLPSGVSDRMIEEQANGSCPKCADCPHDSVEFSAVTDSDKGSYTCIGTCESCDARMEGSGRKREPEGGVEDIEWEVDESRGCGHDEHE